MISRSLLIAGTCLVALMLGAGCVVEPYHGAYRYDVGYHVYHPKSYLHGGHHGGWQGDHWRRHRHRHHH